MSDNAAVNSVVARCLLEPGFLDMLMAGPSGALDEAVCDGAARKRLLELDVSQIRRFAGLVSKVQHNDLWESFPYTRALLKYYSVEIDTFAAYRDSHLRLLSEGKPSREAKAQHFLSFLDTYLCSAGAPDCPGLRDVAMHERLQWEVGLALMSHAVLGRDWDRLDAWEPRRAELQQCVPVVRGVLEVGTFEYDPLWIAARLRESGRHGLEVLRPRNNNLAYWGEPDPPRLHIIELDTLSAAILRLVDGVTPVSRLLSAIPTALCGDDARPKLRATLEAAALEGMVGMLAEVGLASTAGKDEAAPCEYSS